SASGVVQYHAFQKICVSNLTMVVTGLPMRWRVSACCSILSPFSALTSDIQKNRHTTSQSWSVSPVAPCSPGGQAGKDTTENGELTYILIPRESIPFSDCRSLHPRF